MIGRELEVGIGAEETRGTKSTNVKWVKNISANIFEKAEHTIDEATRGVFEDSDGKRVVKKHVEGDVEMPLYANSFGFLAFNLYGSETASLVESGVYDHAFEIEQSSLAPSLTVIAKDGDVAQKAFKNAHINTLELSANMDGYVNVSVNFLAKNSEADTSEPSYDNDVNFIGKEITVRIADTAGGLADATPLCLSEINISYDKGLIEKYCLGSYNPSEIYMSKASIEGSFTKKYEDDTFKELRENDNAKYMEIKIEGETIPSKTSKTTLTFTFYKIQITDWSRSGGNDDLVEENVSFKAFYNSTDNKASKLVIRNTTDEYTPDVSI